MVGIRKLFLFITFCLSFSCYAKLFLKKQKSLFEQRPDWSLVAQQKIIGLKRSATETLNEPFFKGKNINITEKKEWISKVAPKISSRSQFSLFGPLNFFKKKLFNWRINHFVHALEERAKHGPCLHCKKRIEKIGKNLLKDYKNIEKGKKEYLLDLEDKQRKIQYELNRRRNSPNQK
jgi:hypothetical protein